jgi:long-chain fatty acid transport protein
MKKNIIKVAVLAALGLPALASATNGYWATGYGTKSKSIAGACVAMRFGAMCSAINPGSLVFVGNRMEAGAALFAPSRGFTANPDMEMPPQNFAFIAPGTYDSDNDYFLIPHFAYNKMLDENSALGVAIGANGGMNTEYGAPASGMMPAVFSAFNPRNSLGQDPQLSRMPGFENWVSQFDASAPTGIDMMQLFVGVTYSRKINSDHGIGITPVFAIQSFEAQGLEPFKLFSLHPDHVTNNGRDLSYGGGLRVGWSGQVMPDLTLGASYQTKLWMSKFDDYKGLFAEEGGFDIPANFDIGFAFRFAPQWTLAFDYQRIFYSKVNAIGNNSNIAFTPNLVGPAMPALMGMTPEQSGMGLTPALGTTDGLGFGWEDMNVLKFGLQWEYSPEWTFRVGYSYADDTFPSSQALFNILAPATVKEHFAFGFTRNLLNKQTIDLAFTYMPNAKIYGTNPNTGPQTGYVEMDQWEIEVGWSMRW